jgi:hypothetical protein
MAYARRARREDASKIESLWKLASTDGLFSI